MNIQGTVPINTVEDKKVNGANLYAWDDPSPFKKQLPDVDSLPVNVIPEAFHTWIADASERMQIAPDAIAAASIVMVGSVIGTGCGVRPKAHDDWLVIPNLWGAIVSPPSTLKTPAMYEAFKPLRILEAQAKREYDQAFKEYERAQENSNTEVNKPIWKRFCTNDATIEKISDLLSVNPKGILVERDELTGMLSSWEKMGRESDRAFYLESWTGLGSHTVDRITRGTIHVDRLCLSIFGGVQPEKLANYLFHTSKNQNDGLMQRFQLGVYPDQPKEWKVIDRQPNRVAQERVCEIIKTLSQADFTQLGAVENEFNDVPYFHLDDDSQALFYEWWEELQNRKDLDDSPLICEHLAKYRSLAPSLALIFHLIDVISGGQPGNINQLSLSRAISYTEYLETHARRIYSLAASQSVNSAAILAKKIKAGALKEQFTVREVYRKGWHLLATKQHVLEACEELQDLNWIRSYAVSGGYQAPALSGYFVNPKVVIQ